MKKILLLMATFMSAIVLNAQTTIIDSGVCGPEGADNATWTLNSEGVLTISGTGAMGSLLDQDETDFKIPKDKVKKIIIEDGIEKVGQRVIQDLPNLVSISIPESASSITEYSMGNCPALTSLTIPKSIREIGPGAISLTLDTLRWQSTEFESWVSRLYGQDPHLGSVKHLILPEGLATIPDYFCAYMTLGEVEIPSSVVSIGISAFELVKGNPTIILPNQLKTISDLAFQNAAITELDIPSSVDSLGNYALCATTLEEIVIPDNVTKLGSGVFRDSPSLKKVTLGKGITEINDGSFYACPSLQTVIFRGPISKIVDSAFAECYKLSNVSIPPTVTSIGNSAFTNTAIESVVIPAAVTTLGERVFSDCRFLKSITLPDGFTSLGERCLTYCSSLKSIDLPSTLTSIGGYEFQGTSIKKLILPAGLQFVDDYAFASDSLKTIVCQAITPPVSSQSYSSDLFNYSNKLVVYVPEESVEAYKNDARWSKAADIRPIQDYTLTITSNNETWGTATGSGVYSLVDDAPVIEAIAKKGFQFTKWSDGVTEAKRTIELVRDSTITALFELYTVTVSCNTDEGSVTGGGEVLRGESTTLTATPNQYYKFVKWSDEDTSNPRTYVVEGASNLSINLQALFEKTHYEVVVSCPASKAVVSGDGMFAVGETTQVKVEAKEGYKFIQWEDGNTDNPRAVQVVDQDITLTPLFEAFGSCGDSATYFIDIHGNMTISGKGKVTKSFEYDSSIKNLIVEEGVTEIGSYAFRDCSQLVNVKLANSVEKIGESAFEANFNLQRVDLGDEMKEIGLYCFSACQLITNVYCTAPNPPIAYDAFSSMFLFNVYVVPEFYSKYKDQHWPNEMSTIYEIDQCGTITVEADSTQGIVSTSTRYTYPGKSAVITATPKEGYEFVQWNDGVKDSVRTVEVYEPTTFTASFKLQEFELTVSCNAEQGTVTGSGTYTYGTEVEIKATANKDFEFVQWNDGVKDSVRTVEVYENITYTAEFKALPPVAVDEIQESSVEIFTQGNNLYVIGAESYQVYNLIGQPIYMGSEECISLPAGVYIVVADGKSVKVRL